MCFPTGKHITHNTYHGETHITVTSKLSKIPRLTDRDVTMAKIIGTNKLTSSPPPPPPPNLVALLALLITCTAGQTVGSQILQDRLTRHFAPHSESFAFRNLRPGVFPSADFRPGKRAPDCRLRFPKKTPRPPGVKGLSPK